MKTETAKERIRRQLRCVIVNIRADLNRVEILAAALSAFGSPVPDYEPRFRHVSDMTLSAHQI